MDGGPFSRDSSVAEDIHRKDDDEKLVSGSEIFQFKSIKCICYVDGMAF